MHDHTDKLKAQGAALLLLDRESGEIIELNDVAEVLLGKKARQWIGRHWRSCLGDGVGESRPVDLILDAGLAAPLPPTIVHDADGREWMAVGMACPQQYRERAALALYLYPLAYPDDAGLADSPTAGDIVLVLGVDQLGYAPAQAVAATTCLMMDVRTSLLQIVPGQDAVGFPAGCSIPVMLRDYSLDEALDICAALRSHLRRLLASQGEGAENARISIGVAVAATGDTALRVLAAANQALAEIQQSGDGAGVAVAGQGKQVLPLEALSAHGLFSSMHSTGEARAYLTALASLNADSQHPGDYLDKVIELTLAQAGVAAVALYQRRFDDRCDYVAGGLSNHPPSAAGKAGKGLAEQQLPRVLRDWQRGLDHRSLEGTRQWSRAGQSALAAPLDIGGRRLGYLLLGYEKSAVAPGFVPDLAALHQLASQLATLPAWRESSVAVTTNSVEPAPSLLDVEGYVEDNMEGAIDQAMFMARVDMPVAVIGPRGTGKLYVAKIIHQEAGGDTDQLVYIDCREFRSRRDALTRISRELAASEGKTLVFKSPHLMNPEAQLKLARQLSTRILADSNPPRYLPRARYVGLFPDSLEHLATHGGLDEKLASVFAGYPIVVPPLRVRKRAILRWAYKILSQECARRDRKFRGFTPDAQQTLLEYEWPGNISEMRQCIAAALDKSDKDWITPVDLGIFRGIGATGGAAAAVKPTFLETQLMEQEIEHTYSPSPLDELAVALGESLHALLEHQAIKPLGAWVDDELVLAACERYRGDMAGAARFLHTKSRNIGRWMPKILGRDHERSSSMLWQAPRALIRQWVQEAAMPESSPQQLLQEMLMAQVHSQCDSMSVADRAAIMGVSVPTYQKRLATAAP